MIGLLQNFGDEIGIRFVTDATAAKSVACRSDVGSVRHIEVNQLWLQEEMGCFLYRVFE